MVFSDVPSVTDEVIAMVGLIPGLRGVDVGGLGSALAVEALTACLVEINRRYKTHASLRVTVSSERDGAAPLRHGQAAGRALRAAAGRAAR